VEAAAIEGAVQRLRLHGGMRGPSQPYSDSVGIRYGSDVMKPIAAPIVGGMITSAIHVLILVPVFFVMMKERALKHGTLVPRDKDSTSTNNDAVVQPSSLGDRTMQIKLIAPVAALALSAASLLAQATQTISGTVSDAMCGTHHMMKGATAAQCTRECVKQGSDYALVSGGKVYTLKGGKTQFDKFAGENVVVKGKVSGTTIAVDSINASK